jgi:hypothetical protein
MSKGDQPKKKQSYQESVIRNESAGNPNARNPNSSASGKYQFLKGTKDYLNKKAGRNLSDEEAMSMYTSMSLKELEKNNIPPTNRNMYLLHFLGQSGGVDFIKKAQANPAAKASSLVSREVFESNKEVFAPGGVEISSGDLLSKFERKMAGSAPATARSTPQPINNAQQGPSFFQRMAAKQQAESSPSEEGIQEEQPSEQNDAKFAYSNGVVEGIQSKTNFGNRNTIFAAGGDMDYQLPHTMHTTPDMGYADGLINKFNAGGTHEENEFGGIPQGQSQDGSLNTVEEGETRMGDFIFSNRMKLSLEDTEEFYLPKSIANLTFADASKKLNEALERSPFDIILRKTIEIQLDSLSYANEKAKMLKSLDEKAADEKIFGIAQEVDQVISPEQATEPASEEQTEFADGGEMEQEGEEPSSGFVGDRTQIIESIVQGIEEGQEEKAVIDMLLQMGVPENEIQGYLEEAAQIIEDGEVQAQEVQSAESETANLEAEIRSMIEGGVTDNEILESMSKDGTDPNMIMQLIQSVKAQLSQEYSPEQGQSVGPGSALPLSEGQPQQLAYGGRFLYNKKKFSNLSL